MNDNDKIEHDDVDMDVVKSGKFGKAVMASEQTEIEKAVYQITAFKNLLNVLEKIDYRKIKFPKKMAKLYAELNEAAGDGNAMSNIWNEIHKLKISFEEQIVILSKELLELSLKQNLRISFMNSDFYLFDESFGYWKKINKDLIQEFFAEAAVKSDIPIMTAKQKRKKEKLLEQLMSDGIIIEMEDEQNSNRVLINLKNGTYCIENGIGELKPHNPDDKLLYRSDFEYDPNATAPKFQHFLDEVLPDKDTQKVLLEFIGYFFTKGLNMERMGIMYGSGANGKSTIENIIVRMIGEKNVCSFTLAELCDEKGYQRAELAGKMLLTLT
jgi:putative DNA primase/helicase